MNDDAFKAAEQMASQQSKAEAMARLLQRAEDQLQDRLDAEVRAAELIQNPPKLTIDDVPPSPDYQAEIVELLAKANTDRKAAEERQAKSHRWLIATIIALLTLAAAVAALFFG